MVGRRIARWFVAGLALALLTGCMYRGEIERQQSNPAFVREEIARVDAAVERYYEARGVYPIKNSDEATPVYEKYTLDLNRLVQSGMLSSIPANAFDAGGRYYYLLIHPETDPVVMLLDLTWVQDTAELQKAVRAYAAASGGSLPVGTETAPGFYALDYDALKRKPLRLQSPYSNQYLPLLLHRSGDLLIDYSLDLVEASKEAGVAVSEGEDARELLVAASPLAPFRSYPYVWTNGEPVLTAPANME
ncbi:hypothetical protein MO973_08520 [Paenibacillus sp. TRM 82003]|nr:hypothetical protein [Paenibacillus sp. TRM 82003]